MKLFYRKYGEGPPLIIIHGLFGSSDNWVHIARALENCFTVYLPDMRNHGHSPWSNLHSYPAMANDISEFAEDLGLDKFFLAGHSMGGKTAIYTAVSNPGRLHGLFVGDISPFPYPADGEAVEQQMTILSAMMSTDPAQFNNRNDLEDYLVNVAGEKATRNILSKNIAYEAGKLRWRMNFSSINANLDNLREGFPRELQSVNIIESFPVIFMKGSDSQYISTEDLKGISRMFPGAQIRIASGAGHWIHTEKTDDVIQAIKDLKTLSLGEKCD